MQIKKVVVEHAEQGMVMLVDDRPYVIQSFTVLPERKVAILGKDIHGEEFTFKYGVDDYLDIMVD